jgi:hypothetical protein
MSVHQQHVDRSPGLPNCFQKTVRFIVFDDVEDTGQEYHQLASLAEAPVLLDGEGHRSRQSLGQPGES